MSESPYFDVSWVASISNPPPHKHLNLSHFYVNHVLNFVALPFFFFLLLSVTVFKTISSARCFRSEISLLWLEMKKQNEWLHQFILNHTHTIALLTFVYIGVFFCCGSWCCCCGIIMKSRGGRIKFVCVWIFVGLLLGVANFINMRMSMDSRSRSFFNGDR